MVPGKSFWELPFYMGSKLVVTGDGLLWHRPESKCSRAWSLIRQLSVIPVKVFQGGETRIVVRSLSHHPDIKAVESDSRAA